MPMTDRSQRLAPEIISDVAPTPFGSKSLRVMLCRPTPTLADQVVQRVLAVHGEKHLDALRAIVAAATPDQDRVVGTLDGNEFDLRRGVDFFASATEQFLAARARSK
mmetsp:Transcript_1517/g.4584  ORF Transcript_1517/g.4584 Transcript_1517/m.4584 type:complete len:107 (+) Transcript_1517:3514-3834(+)